MISITFGRPRISLKKTGEEGLETVDTGNSIFTVQNFVILGSGIALGIILKQQSDIQTLKRTVEYLQGALRG